MVKTGSINMAKAIRRIGHRSGQARKMTFYRDALESRDDYGVETDFIASGNEGLTIPNIDAFIAPIITSSDSMSRAGHTVIGSAVLYIPSLSNIKKNVLGINSAGDTTARLSSFNELESKDILYDMEKIVFSQETADTLIGSPPSEGYEFAANTSAYEVDRLQFKVKDNAGDNRVKTIVIATNEGARTLTWTFEGADDAVSTGNRNFDNNKYHIINLPLSGVENGDKTYYIYVPEVGKTEIRTLTATVVNSFDIKKIDGELITLDDIVITSKDSGMTTKDLHLYKAGEWRIENIKEYRDEYMELGCTKMRGDRGSTRRRPRDTRYD